MSDRATDFTGSIPQFYDHGLGPVFLTDFADDIARRAASSAPMRFRTRSGHRHRDAPPARSAAARSSFGRHRPQATNARSRSRKVSSGRNGFQPADATALPFPNASFDSVVCQFGVMFFPDTSVAISAANIRYTEARPIRNWRAIDWQLSDDGGQGPSGGGRRTRCQYYSTRTVNPCLSKIGFSGCRR